MKSIAEEIEEFLKWNKEVEEAVKHGDFLLLRELYQNLPSFIQIQDKRKKRNGEI